MVIADPLTLAQRTASDLAPGDSGGIEFNAPQGFNPIPASIKSDFAKWAKKGFKFSTVNGRVQVENKNGQVVGGMAAGFDPEEMQGLLAEGLGKGTSGIVGIDDDGNLYVDTGPTGARNPAPAGIKHAAGSSGGGTQGGASGRTAGRGNTAGGSAGGTSRSGGGGGTSGASRRGGPTGGGTTVTTQGGGGATLGGGGGGPSPIDPNAPLGVGFGGAEGRIDPGERGFNDAGVFDRPGSFTEGLGEDASLNDILLGAMGEQRATRDAALNIQGGLARGFEDSSLRGQNEQNALELGANPFSLDDQTVGRIMGQQGDLIGRNTERLQQTSAARAASSGVSRSGIQQADQDRIDIAGAQQLGDAQRGLLVEQATRRPQELGQAINVGNDTLEQQTRARESIAGGAVNILAGSNPTADAALLGTLAGGGTPQIKIGDRGNPFNPAGFTTAGNNRGGLNRF